MKSAIPARENANPPPHSDLRRGGVQRRGTSRRTSVDVASTRTGSYEGAFVGREYKTSSTEETGEGKEAGGAINTFLEEREN